jgi:hypothetical protein
MSAHSPISDYHARAIDHYLSLSVAGSSAGPTLDRAALYMLTSDKDEHAKHIPRSFALPREPVYGSSGQVIGKRIALDARITAETKPAPTYEPNFDSSVMRALVSRRFERMAHAGLWHELHTLAIYFGVPGHTFDPGGKAPRLPRVWSLLHVTPAGVEVLQREQRIREKEQHDAAERRRAARQAKPGKVVSAQGAPVEPVQAPIYQHGAHVRPEERTVQGIPLAELGRMVGVTFTAAPAFVESAATNGAPGPRLQPFEKMRNLCFVVRQSKYKGLQDLFAAAERAAVERYRVAAEAWNDADGG